MILVRTGATGGAVVCVARALWIPTPDGTGRHSRRLGRKGLGSARLTSLASGGDAGEPSQWNAKSPGINRVPNELRRRPEELREGSLSHFVLSVANNVLRDGVSFGTPEDLTGGIRVRLQEGEIQVDLTPEKVAEVLLEHLHPRFRAILEGTVK